MTQASLSETASRRSQLATNAAAPHAVAFDLSDAVERLVAILGVTEGILEKTVLLEAEKGSAVTCSPSTCLKHPSRRVSTPRIDIYASTPTLHQSS